MLHTIESGLYKIRHNDMLDEQLKLSVLEERFKARYIGEFSINNNRVALFYQDEIPEQYRDVGSNYLAVYLRDGQMYVTNGLPVVERTWLGVVNPETKDVLYSATRHDFQCYGDLMADGGADYLRSSLHPQVKMRIILDRLTVVE